MRSSWLHCTTRLLGRWPGGVVMIMVLRKALQAIVVARGDARRVGACFCWAGVVGDGGSPHKNWGVLPCAIKQPQQNERQCERLRREIAAPRRSERESERACGMRGGRPEAFLRSFP